MRGWNAGFRLLGFYSILPESVQVAGAPRLVLNRETPNEPNRESHPPKLLPVLKGIARTERVCGQNSLVMGRNEGTRERCEPQASLA